MSPLLKKLLLIGLAIIAIVFLGKPDSDCEDCTKIVSSTVVAENLSEDEIKQISKALFTPQLFAELDQSFPKYAGTFETERLTFQIRTKRKAMDINSTTVFAVGFKYKGTEEQQNPSIVKDAQQITKILSKKLHEVVMSLGE